MGLFGGKSQRRNSEGENITGAAVALATIRMHALAEEITNNPKVNQTISGFIDRVFPFDPEAAMRVVREQSESKRSELLAGGEWFAESFTSGNLGMRRAIMNSSLMNGHILPVDFYAKEIYSQFFTGNELNLVNPDTKEFDEDEFASRIGLQNFGDFGFCRLIGSVFFLLQNEDKRFPFAMATVNTGLVLSWKSSPERNSLILEKKKAEKTRKSASPSAKPSGHSQVTLEFRVEVQSLSPMVDVPTGKGIASFHDDGSYEISLDDNSALFQGDVTSPVKWTDGLMRGVDEGYIYISLGYMLVARLSDKKRMKMAERWLTSHHPQE